MTRTATIERTTGETDVRLTLALEGAGDRSPHACISDQVATIPECEREVAAATHHRKAADLDWEYDLYVQLAVTALSCLADRHVRSGDLRVTVAKIAGKVGQE